MNGNDILTRVLLDPKTQFQADVDISGQFRNIARGVVMQKALSSAVAYYAVTYSPSSDQMIAVKQFIDVLLNIGEAPGDAPAREKMPRLLPPEQIAEMSMKLRKEQQSKPPK